MAERRPGPPPTGRPPALPREGTFRLPAAVHAARRRAEEILAAAQHEREVARQEGHVEGWRQAREEAAALLATTRRAAARKLADGEADLVRLALHIAERLLHRELAQHPEAIADLVAGLLREARGQSPLLLRLHPADADALERSHPRLAELLGELPEFRVETATDLGRGSCLLEGPDVTVDGRLEIRLANLERALLGADGEPAPASRGEAE